MNIATNTGKAIASVAAAAAAIVSVIVTGGETGLGWMCLGLYFIWYR